MKSLKTLLIGAVALVIGSAAPAAADSIRYYGESGRSYHRDSGRSVVREHRQEKRIYRGAIRGELTPMELRKLARQQERIDRAQWRAGRDGYVSRSERRKLERMQDRANRNIYRKKHNSRDLW